MQPWAAAQKRGPLLHQRRGRRLQEEEGQLPEEGRQEGREGEERREEKDAEEPMDAEEAEKNGDKDTENKVSDING